MDFSFLDHLHLPPGVKGLLEFLEKHGINKPWQWHLLCEVIIAFE